MRRKDFCIDGAWAAWPRADRLALLKRILALHDARSEELAPVLTREMGAPIAFSRDAQVF